ncbi:MAG: adenosine deaminase [Solirubrobacteraceae bacterium]
MSPGPVALAELHVHVEGTAPPALLRRIARRNGLEVPPELIGAGDRYAWRDFAHFLELYDTATGVMRTVEDYRDVVYEYLVSTGAQYVELTASPDHAAAAGLSDAEHAFAIGRGIDDARLETGVEAAIIMTAVRDRGPEAAEEVARRAVALHHPRVVGFGLAGNESDHPPERFARAFAVAHEGGLGCTVHAGEWGGPDAVRAALELPGVTRLGHCVRAAEDPALVAELAERGTVLEVCPTANVVLGVYPSYAQHPLRALFDAGVRVTLGSDDPPYWGTTLGGEYDVVLQPSGFNKARPATVTQTALRARFPPAPAA